MQPSWTSDLFFFTQCSLRTSVVFLALHDTLLTTRRRRGFIVYVFCVFLDGRKCCGHNVIFAQCSECQCGEILKQARTNDRRVTMTLVKLAKSLHVCSEYTHHTQHTTRFLSATLFLQRERSHLHLQIQASFQVARGLHKNTKTIVSCDANMFAQQGMGRGSHTWALNANQDFAHKERAD